ncbi:MAG TPA: antibiotic biosynthesis monooxygenase [Actinomycetes bacterium]|nr:antibiotic biosynthesis monooxygenase [Actinomycetes bacterium]
MALHTLVVTRYRVSEGTAASFRDRIRDALEAFAATPGFVDGRVGRSTDEAGLWVLELTFRDVGSYRRALSSYDVKLRAVPVMYDAVDEPSAYEVLEQAGVGGRASSDLAADAGAVNLGEAAAPVVVSDLD